VTPYSVSNGFKYCRCEQALKWIAEKTSDRLEQQCTGSRVLAAEPHVVMSTESATLPLEM